MGPGGYKAKILEWRKMEEQLEKTGIANPISIYDEFAKNWIMARSTTQDGQLVPRTSKVSEVVQRVKDIAAKEKDGLFKQKQQNDLLNATLETKEHRGRVKGVSSMASWKQAFDDDSASYKKRRSLKQDSEKEELQKWTDCFFKFIKENPQYMQQQIQVLEIRLNV